ncbi:MAG TPA: hypothetical protein ENK63_05270, partial [Rhodobacterales bacterium]|nr:hypothetical protein [Rhodobacterales bacterium]
AGAGRPPPEIGALTPARALRAALAWAAQDAAGLVAVAGDVAESRTTREPATEALPEFPLLALLIGPREQLGLMVLDPQSVAALIEFQTTGRVVPRPAPVRAPTRTDAVMCADFIDSVLEHLEVQVSEAELPVAPALTGYRYSMALPEPRAMEMTLEDLPYRQMSVSVDFGHGAKTGQITLLLPYAPPDAKGGTNDATAFREALEAQVLDTEAQLNATLAHHEMTLSEITNLSPGVVIPLPHEALSAIRIEDLSGQTVAFARLGQAEGHRALRIQAEMTDSGAHDAPGMGRSMASGRAKEPAPAPSVPAQIAGLDDGMTLPVDAGNDQVSDGDLPALAALGDFGTQPGAEAADGLGGLPDIDGLADLASLSDPLAEAG